MYDVKFSTLFTNTTVFRTIKESAVRASHSRSGSTDYAGVLRCLTAAWRTSAIRASNAFSWSMRATRTCRRKKRAAAFLWRPVPDVCLCACRIRSMLTFIDFAKIFDGFGAFELRQTSRNKRTNSELSPIFFCTRYFSYLFYFVLRYLLVYTHACTHTWITLYK